MVNGDVRSPCKVSDCSLQFSNRFYITDVPSNKHTNTNQHTISYHQSHSSRDGLFTLHAKNGKQRNWFDRSFIFASKQTWLDQLHRTHFHFRQIIFKLLRSRMNPSRTKLFLSLAYHCAMKCLKDRSYNRTIEENLIRTHAISLWHIKRVKLNTNPWN